MRPLFLLSLLTFPPIALHAQTATPDPAGVLSQLTVSRFIGSGSQTIQAMTSDAAGNIYVAGTTTSPDLPTKNASQPALGRRSIFRTVDRGTTWQPVPNPPAVPLTLTPHPTDSKTLFIGASDGIYKTSNSGQNWRHVYSWATMAPPKDEAVSPTGYCCYTIALDPANTLNAYAYVDLTQNTGRFLASSDGGETWQSHNVTLPLVAGFSSTAPALWVDPNGSGTIGLGFNLSKDRGLTWTLMSALPAFFASFTVPVPQHPGWIYGASSLGSTDLYLSQDWGVTWTTIGTPRPPAGATGLANLFFDPDVPNTLYAVDINTYLFVSTDAGTTWKTTSATTGGSDDVPPAILSRQCMGGAILRGGYEPGGRIGVVASFDFGVTWQPGQLTQVFGLSSGPACSVYAIRSLASDAFVAKVAPGGTQVLWSTFLGGSDRENSAFITLDPQGNVYVAGTTGSSDFPATTPRNGPTGATNVFAAKFDADGNLLYSSVFGGEFSDTPTGFSVDAQGQAYIAGTTNSKSFPATAGAFLTTPANADGFAVKLDPNGLLAYATFLTNDFIGYLPYSGVEPTSGTAAISAESGGSALIGNSAGVLSRLSADWSSLTAVSQLPGPIFSMQTDSQGNLFVAGQTNTGSVSVSCAQGAYFSLPAADIFLTKLQPASLQQTYSARFGGACQSQPGTIQVASNGEATLGLWTYTTMPVRNPVLSSPHCGEAAGIVRFSADGSQSIFSTYLDVCAVTPALALAPDGSIYAASSSSILQMPVASSTGPQIETVANSFSGNVSGATPGALLTINGENLSPTFIDLGLNDPNALPTQLGGVQVLFNGSPAQIFQVAPYHVICVVPSSFATQTSATVQVVSASGKATPFVLLKAGFATTAYLSTAFPELPAPGSVDGVIRNQDGTLNSATNPAAPGSAVTLFANGMYTPGAVQLLWNAPPPSPFVLQQYLAATALPMTGFISAMYAIEFTIPSAAGPGVYTVPTPGVLTRFQIGNVGNGLGVYVK